MKRQAMTVTIEQLEDLIIDLEKEITGANFVPDKLLKEYIKERRNRKFQINIINKTPECSDTWKIEDVLDS